MFFYRFILNRCLQASWAVCIIVPDFFYKFICSIKIKNATDFESFNCFVGVFIHSYLLQVYWMILDSVSLTSVLPLLRQKVIIF